MTPETDSNINMLSFIVAGAVLRDDLGIGRNFLAKIKQQVGDIPAQEQTGTVISALQKIWSCRRVDFCREALDTLLTSLPQQDQKPVNNLFRFSLEYIEGGRDPYFLMSLQPDIREATKLLLSRLDPTEPL